MNKTSDFSLYGRIEKVEGNDDGTIMVHGIVSTEDVDSVGEIVTADAMRASLAEYKKFPTIREMHQLSAAGKALEIEVGDDNITRVVAHIVDEKVVAKIRAGVYSGFSVGGKVTKRNSSNSKIIEGILLKEISVVDSPANRKSIIEVWKADAAEPLGQRMVEGGTDDMAPVKDLGSLTVDQVRDYLASISNEDRAALMIQAIMRGGIGRRY